MRFIGDFNFTYSCEKEHRIMFSNQLPLNYNTENVPHIYSAILERYIFIKTQRSIFFSENSILFDNETWSN